MAGVKFPDDMIGKSVPMNENDKVLISDSQADKVAKWWSLANIVTWLTSLFSKIDGSNITGANLHDFQATLKIALLSNSIKEVPSDDVYSISDNGFYITDVGTTNLPSGANKVGYIKSIRYPTGNLMYLIYNTWSGGALQYWATHYNGSSWESWALSGSGGSGGSTFKVTGSDTTPGYLTDKLIMGNGVSADVINAGGNETYRLNSISGSAVTNEYPEIENIVGYSLSDAKIHSFSFIAENDMELKSMIIALEGSSVNYTDVVLDIFDHEFTPSEVLGLAADDLLTGYDKRQSNLILTTTGSFNTLTLDSTHTIKKGNTYSICIYSRGSGGYPNKGYFETKRSGPNTHTGIAYNILSSGGNIIAAAATTPLYFKLFAENKVEAKDDGVIEIAGKNLTYNGVPFVPVVLGKASVVSSTNISKTSTSYSDTGIELQYTPKKAGTQLEISVSGLGRLYSNQKGFNLNINYSLDGGVTYSNKLIFSRNKRYVNTENEYEPVTGIIVLDTPSIPLQCIFKLQMKVTTSGETVSIGEGIQTILTVTEELI